MTPCFADTFFFLALLNKNDKRFYDRAVELNKVDRRIVTSAWVLLELSDHLCDARNRHLPARLRGAIAVDDRFEVVSADQMLLNRATDLFNQRQDKEWSLTDCTSFIIMQDRGIIDALTADRHFEQAEFNTLFK